MIVIQAIVLILSLLFMYYIAGLMIEYKDRMFMFLIFVICMWTIVVAEDLIDRVLSGMQC